MTDKSAREIIAQFAHSLVATRDTRVVTDGDAADRLIAMFDAGGFAVVPKEPTPEMLTAMHDAWDYFDANSDVFRREYKAALAASNPKEEGSDN